MFGTDHTNHTNRVQKQKNELGQIISIKKGNPFKDTLLWCTYTKNTTYHIDKDSAICVSNKTCTITKNEL
jgi:hypothetical protein